jgi:TRAP transporter TAXI family solute receptor
MDSTDPTDPIRSGVMAKTKILLVALLVLSLSLAGIFIPQPSQAQTAAPKHEIVRVKLLSMSLGGTVYVLSFALAEVINKTHPWLRVECIEGRGSEANLKTLSENPAMRKDTFIFTQEVSNVEAREGREPLKSAYTGARAIGAMSQTMLALVTLDKNTKTKEGFAGKRVMNMRPGTTTAKLYDILFKDVWGLGDRVKVSYGTFDSIKDALQDGLVDIGCQPLTGNVSGYWAPIPSLLELMTTKDVYFLNVSPDAVKGMAEKSHLPIFPEEIPAGSLGPKQPQPVQGYGHSLSWWADQEMDPEIIYEITKTIYENRDKFIEVAADQGKFIDPKTMTMINVTENMFHPGALKFYKEKGLKVGVQ